MKYRWLILPCVLIPVILLLLQQYHRVQHKKEFKEFADGFTLLNISSVPSPFLTFCNTDEGFFDYPVSGNDLVDSLLITKYGLFKNWQCSNFPPASIRAIKFRKIGRLKQDDKTALIYEGFTCEAGSGNPAIIMAIFNDGGEKISEMKVLEDVEMDELTQPFSIFHINSDSTFENTEVTRNYGYLRGQRLLKDSTKNVTEWLITSDGHILKKGEKEELPYKNNLPGITDTI